MATVEQRITPFESPAPEAHETPHDTSDMIIGRPVSRSKGDTGAVDDTATDDNGISDVHICSFEELKNHMGWPLKWNHEEGSYKLCEGNWQDRNLTRGSNDRQVKTRDNTGDQIGLVQKAGQNDCFGLWSRSRTKDITGYHFNGDVKFENNAGSRSLWYFEDIGRDNLGRPQYHLWHLYRDDPRYITKCFLDRDYEFATKSAGTKYELKLVFKG